MVEPQKREVLALAAWGEALRADRARIRKRARTGLGLATGCACLLATAVERPRPKLVWNASASAPIGLYLVSPQADLADGDMVIAWPPGAFAALAAARQYLPAGIPLVKRIAGIPGDEICALGPRLFLNGAPLAERSKQDGAGRPMPWWSGCRRLRDGQFLLLMTGRPTSFDGRYFGLTARRDILGRARLLWPR